MKLGESSLKDIAKLRPDSVKRRRVSSYDKKGDNRDSIAIKSGEKVILAEVDGAGKGVSYRGCRRNYGRHRN